MSAIVTGASRNIGAAIAIRLARDGFPVAVNHPGGDQANAANEVVGRITNEGGRAIAVEADVADENAVATMVELVAERIGPPRVLVNNAAVGVARQSPWDADDAAEWERILRVNVIGAFLCAKHCAPHLEHGGCIVNVASLAAVEGLQSNLPYVVSKAAVLRLTESLAHETGWRGIRVNAVMPGPVDTPQQRDVFGPAAQGRITPEDVAAVVSFLASDAAAVIHGECIPVSAE